MLATGAPLDFLSSEDREWLVGNALAEVLNRPEDPCQLRRGAIAALSSVLEVSPPSAVNLANAREKRGALWTPRTRLSPFPQFNR